MSGPIFDLDVKLYVAESCEPKIKTFETQN